MAYAGGKTMLNVIGAFAQFERDLLIERTKAGLDRAKAQGKTLGRPKSLTDKQKEAIRRALANGETISGWLAK
ncbi:recombinase family protein [Agrobacterium tumefaciens]|nr:recombinase family protein [Agrobacterium tumefaciens]NTC45039.1 recombinase family protein [Agrobacterium tumefaciens]